MSASSVRARQTTISSNTSDIVNLKPMNIPRIPYESAGLFLPFDRGGSANTGKLTVNLVSENGEALKNISGELSTKGVRVGEEKSGSFRIVANGNSGDVINANIVVADEDGNSWSTPVSLTIK